MSNRKPPSQRTLLVITLVTVTAVASLATYVKLTPADKVPAGEHRDHVGQAKPPRVDVRTERIRSDEASVLVYSPRATGNSVTWEHREVAVPPSQDPKVFAVNEFLHSTKIVEPNARLLAVDVEDGVAKLSFNAAFASGYGTGDEQVLLDGLRRSMGQFSEVKRLAILVDGQELESLGNVDLTEGLDVIKP